MSYRSRERGKICHRGACHRGAGREGRSVIIIEEQGEREDVI